MAKSLLIIGGSSLKNLCVLHLLKESCLDIEKVYLLGRNKHKLTTTSKILTQFIHKTGLRASVEALTPGESDIIYEDVDIVINLLNVGGCEVEIKERATLLGKGIYGHAASYFEAIRNLPPSLNYAKAIEKKNKNAIFINFTNPVSILTEAIATRTNLCVYGLCYHTSLMYLDFASLLDTSPLNLRIDNFGLNHVSWVQRVYSGNKDLTSTLFSKLISKKYKRYNYWFIREFRAIPITHTASLMKKGEKWWYSLDGIRGNLKNYAYKWHLLRHYTCNKKTSRLEKIFKNFTQKGIQNLEIMDNFAPWYNVTFLPFMKSLFCGNPNETIVTWSPEVNPLGVGKTIESSVYFKDGKPTFSHDPRNWSPNLLNVIKVVRESESLFIDGLIEKREDILKSSLLIHQNVKEITTAISLLKKYIHEYHV